MAARLELQAALKQICNNVYFQPPPQSQMSYPAIVYHLDGVDTKRADNGSYGRMVRYSVKVIDEDPDSIIPTQLESAFPMCSFSTSFKADFLNHYVYSLFY